MKTIAQLVDDHAAACLGNGVQTKNAARVIAKAQKSLATIAERPARITVRS